MGTLLCGQMPRQGKEGFKQWQRSIRLNLIDLDLI
jgi:hypothetical protein